MSSRRRVGAVSLIAALAAGGACAHPGAPPPAAAPADPDLDGPIAEMKGIVPSRFTDGQAHAKDQALDRAWSTLKAHRDRAVPRLERELAALRASGRRDDFFSIDAACLLWELAGVEAAGPIAEALDGVDLSAHFEVIFPTFSAAAATHDPRVLPILWHALATTEKTGTIFFPEHFLKIGWPTTLDFMFDPFGPALCEHLPLGPETVRDPAVAASVLYLGYTLACASALPSIRAWARRAQGELRKEATVAVSHLGAPEDRDVLVALADSPDTETRRVGAFALYEYGDPATAPTLRKLLTDPAPAVRIEAIAGVFHLIDTDGARALIQRRKDPQIPQDEAEKIDAMIAGVARDTAVDRAALAAGDARLWQTAIAKYWKDRDAFFALRPGDRRLTRDELERALELWTQAGRLAAYPPDWTAWIETRHLLSVTTAADIPKLVAVRGSILRRHSDEALEEIGLVDRMLLVLRRRAAGAAKPNE